MDDTTHRLLMTVAATLARRALLAAGMALAGHGVIGSSGVQEFVEAGIGVLTILASLGYDMWVNYGQAIVRAKLEVWKHDALAQRDQLVRAGMPAVSAASVADRIPDPKITTAVVTKVITAGCVLMLICIGGNAYAQSDTNSRLAAGARPAPHLTGNIARDVANMAASQSKGGDDQPEQVWQNIRGMIIVDAKYAKALADNISSPAAKARSGCYSALIKVNEQANGVGAKDASGNDLGPPPDPGAITKVEQAAEVIENLDPKSDLMLACSAAASLVRANVLTFINSLVTGAAIVPKLPIP